MTLNNISITATVPTSGYAPGQVIPLQIDVNNKSNKNILEFKVELNKVRLDNYTSDTKKVYIYSSLLILKVLVYIDITRKQSKKHKSLLTSVFFGGCPANTSAAHTPQVLVPPVPATDVVSSKILHITYELKVNPRFLSYLEINISVFISKTTNIDYKNHI